MASYSTDRRGALKIIGAIGATCGYPYAGDELYGQTVEHHHEAAPPALLPHAPPPKPSHRLQIRKMPPRTK